MAFRAGPPHHGAPARCVFAATLALGYDRAAMIQMFHVTKAYPGDPPVLVDINLDIEKGEFV